MLYHIYLKVFRNNKTVLPNSTLSTSQNQLENIGVEIEEERSSKESSLNHIVPESLSPVNFQEFPSSSRNNSSPVVTSGKKDPTLYNFLWSLLTDPNNKYSHCIVWKNKSERIFKIINSKNLASLWGEMKNRPNMTYDNMARSLRNYYSKGTLAKVQNELLCYRFLAQPPERIPNVSNKRRLSNFPSKKKEKEINKNAM